VQGARGFLGRHLPGHATLVAYLALFVALGGGAYALSGIPDRGGVFHGCVSNKSGVLRVVKAASKCHRARGRGRRRDPGEFAVSWNQQGPRGLRGASGAKGQAFDANATLPPGQTLSGVWTVGGGASDDVGTQVQFTPRLSADLPASAVQRVFSAGSPQCPGPGRAARGFFCLYEKASSLNFIGIFDAVSNGPGANRTGAVIDYSGTGGNQAAVGTWAVTAP
jgi:hypothetical protein